MKKILFLLALVLGCVSVQAQEMIKVYKNGKLIKIYGNDSDNSYKVVVGNGGDGKVHETVDLGLSVKWATCNVGADSPYKAGSYFALGEVAPKSYYSQGNYKYNYCGTYTKYNSYGVLDPEDDAATVNWGLDYRMPTKAEFQELVDSCTWTWDSTNKGYTATSKINGNSIFFPAAGEYFLDRILDNGTKGYYGTSTLGGSTAYELYFNNESWNFTAPQISGTIRYNGMPVRPVEKP